MIQAALEVDFFSVETGEPARVGTIRWDVRGFTLDPPGLADLQNVLREPVHVPLKAAVYWPTESPREWLEHLHLNYRSAYFGAGRAREVRG